MREVTPNELYAIEPRLSDSWLFALNGCYYQHVPEVDGLQLLNEDPNGRIVRKLLRHINYDGRRYWELATIWFDGKPVMITQNAGREGDDSHARFITDSDTYCEMVRYLRSLTVTVNESDVVDPTVPRNDLLSFYGDSFIPPVQPEFSTAKGTPA